MMKHLYSFSEAIAYLFEYIPKVSTQQFEGEKGLQRQKLLLKYLEDPQEKIRVIHIAGTSGKGSTAYLTSVALHSQGFTTGLHLSPHLVDIRERCLVNNQYISEEKFVRYLNEILTAVEKVHQSSFGSPTYFEILVALAFYIFWKEKVDFAVMETGLGGLYDGTNVVRNPGKITVITQIGLDHMNILGNTIDKIAHQKAEIIHSGNTVLSVWQRTNAREEIEKVVKRERAQLFYLRKGKEYSNVEVSKDGTSFDFDFEALNFHAKIGMVGLHQAQNASIALAALQKASSQYQFVIDLQLLREAFQHAHFPGRLDIQQVRGKTLILDGAHNPQKMKSMLTTLTKLYPGSKFNFLIAFKKGKDSRNMLSHIVPLASNITVSRFYTNQQDMPHVSQSPEVLEKVLEDIHFKSISLTNTPEEGLRVALSQSGSIVVVTGSLYFLSEIYKLLPKFIHSKGL